MINRILRVGAATIALAIGAGVAVAQEETNQLRFEVASVKVDRAGTGGAGDKFPKHGTWKWTRIPLSFLVMYAYDVSLNQIANIPDSFQGLETAFTITAKMPPDVTDAQFRMMLQSLLAERFQFVMHREMRDLPVNTIEVAKGGPKLQPPSGECVQVQQSATPPRDRHRCGEVKLRYQIVDGVNRQQYFGRSVSVADLAAAMSPNGPVIDDTGIQGLWDIDVSFAVPSYPPSEDTDENESRRFDYSHTVRAAFEKQLGLSIDLVKLKKRPMPFIVVDHVELPTPN